MRSTAAGLLLCLIPLAAPAERAASDDSADAVAGRWRAALARDSGLSRVALGRSELQVADSLLRLAVAEARRLRDRGGALVQPG